MKEETKKVRINVTLFGYLQRLNVYILRLKHDFIMQTKHVTFSLILASDLNRQPSGSDPIECVSNKFCSTKIELYCARSHRLHIKFICKHAVLLSSCFA